MSNPQISTKMRLQFGELNITPGVEERLEELGYTVAELADAIAEHKSECDGEPSVYVGTYGKYNDGSLCGLWIDLSSFNAYDDFIDFCKAIHADEEDPELMAQDYEGFPPANPLSMSVLTASTTTARSAVCGLTSAASTPTTISSTSARRSTPTRKTRS